MTPKVLAPLLVALLLVASCSAAPDRQSADDTPSPTVPSVTPLPPVPSPSPTREVRCPQAPAWTGSGTRFGTNVSVGGTRSSLLPHAADATFGHLGAVRVFDPSVPPTAAWSRRGPTMAGRSVVTSFRMPPRDVLAGRYDDQILQFFRATPADVTLFWSYYHEPEAEIDAGQFTAAEFRAAFRRLAGLAQRLCRHNLYPTLILTGYTVEPESGRSWVDYYPGGDVVSVLGWDPYNHASGQPTTYEDPATLYDNVVAVSRAAGKPFGIAETGSQLVPGDASGAGRAAWLRSVGDYLRAEGAVFALYFNSVGTSGADYRLSDPKSIEAWKYWVKRQ